MDHIYSGVGLDVDPFTILHDYLKIRLKKYTNWIIVSGSILTIQSDIKIDSLLNNFFSRNYEFKQMYEAYINEMKQGNYNNGTALAEQIESKVETSHNSGNIQVQNRTIIINNVSNNTLSSQKEFISNEDLPLLSSEPNNYKVITEQMSTYPPLDLSIGDVKLDRNDPYAIFNLTQSTTESSLTSVGIEICLDHSNNRLRKNMDLNSSILQQEHMKLLHIQLIPSAGMQIHASDVSTDVGGFVFNVDGEYALNGTAGVNSLSSNYIRNNIKIPYISKAYPDGTYTYGAHSQLAVVATPASGSNPGSQNATFKNLNGIVDIETFPVTAPSNFTDYYGGGVGEIEVYGLTNPMSLYPSTNSRN